MKKPTIHTRVFCPVCKGHGLVSAELFHDVAFVFGFVYDFREKLKSLRGPWEAVEHVYLTVKNSPGVSSKGFVSKIRGKS